MKKSLYILPLALMAVACSQKANPGVSEITGSGSTIPEPVALTGKVADSHPNYVRLKASVFKMSGDYANNVAVTLGPDGQLVYFPAPSDLTAESAPVEIGEGWWLNRQGMAANSVFTSWTFDEYRNLKSVPTPSEIKAKIIPGAKVTDFRQLVLPASEARNLPPEQLLRYVKDLD